MTTQRTLLLISIILVLFSCEKKQSELEFEQSVVYEIFPALMDSLHFDFRLNPPPPPRPVFNEKGEIIGTDTTGIGKALSDYEKKKAELKADSVKLVVAIRDSVYPLELDEKNQLLEHFQSHNLKLDSTDLSTEYKIDLNKLIADKNLRFKYLSDFPEGTNIWKKDYDFHFSGVAYLSRIQFDKTKNFGVLESEISCGRLCGAGIRVFIKKVKGKWIIEKIEDTWVS
ncbi:hypothetical protein [Psychroflexus planctonicus]|uniref:Lipoprotein n=1 Tax=Psychroflexus planctonicus TaxID=1526575 RepID=A0ABQ1SFS8_9FLAO|nr:hypothetical protein [Psychroflexus planctonicus]GGE29132.1 hypothetical protein GCM10010832_07160 [Psychroflexus planctonicus]